MQAKIKFFEEKVVEAAKNEECNMKKLEEAQYEIARNNDQYEGSIKELEAKQIAALENKEIEFRKNKNKLEDLKDNSKNKLESVKDNLKEKLDESVEMKNKSRES